MTILPLALGLVLGLLPAEVTAEEPPAAASEPTSCAESVAARVQAHYEGVRDLRADFEQRTHSAAFGGGSLGADTSRGEVVFAKPGRMRWEYREPEPSLVVSDGETLWIYDPAAGEAQAMPVSEGFLSGAAFQFLLGEGSLLDAFAVTAETCPADPVRLDLRPRTESTYERLQLWVDPGTGAVTRTAVDDLFGNRTEVDFRDLRQNQDPPPARFRFEAPEGVRVETFSVTSPE